MTPTQRAVRLATTLAVAQPRLWRLLRAPFRRYFDSLAPRWELIAGAAHLDALAAALADVPPPRRALDIGTGTGLAASLVAHRFPTAEVVGVDLSRAMVAVAQARGGERMQFVVADASQLPLATGSFDLVMLVNMIPFFDELDRVLAPDGTLLVSYSKGPATPIWVPAERLRSELAQRGFSQFSEVAAGAATCFAARRNPSAIAGTTR